MGPSDAPTVDPVLPMRYLQDPRTAPRPLRVIFIEASEADVAILTAELAHGGFEVTGRRVDSAAGLREVLLATPPQANADGAPWDIVLADYGLPGLDALAALSVLRELGLDLPFIIVSGAAAEEGAVAALRAGAHDCISKPRLARLVPAVQRELREATTRAEQRRLQEQLMVAERMASVGTLAAGVAHEINNPLAAVVANLELALRTVERLPAELPDLAELRAELRDAHEAAHLVRQIVRDVKVFSRSVDERAGPVDVRQVLDSTVRMAWNEIRHRARLLKHYDAVPPVWTTDARLGQVFLNLLINAAQAIEIGPRRLEPDPPGHPHRRSGPGAGGDRRHGRGHLRREPGPHLRPLLHHQAPRQRHRSRPVHLPSHRPGAGRRAPPHQRARPRHHRQRRPPRRQHHPHRRLSGVFAPSSLLERVGLRRPARARPRPEAPRSPSPVFWRGEG